MQLNRLWDIMDRHAIPLEEETGACALGGAVLPRTLRRNQKEEETEWIVHFIRETGKSWRSG